MPPLTSTIISIVFLFVGAFTVYVMMSIMGAHQPAKPELYRKMHRIAGWIYVILFIAMLLFMLGKLEKYWEEPPSRITLHISLALILFLLLFLKVIIPRFFPRLGKNLFLIGFSVYLISFTLVGLTAGYFIIRRSKQLPYISHAELPERMLDERFGKELFITKCSTCHMIKDIMKPRSKEAWEKVLNEMLILAEPRITGDEMAQILYYLSLTHVPQPYRGAEDASPVDRHCLPCHDAKEIYGKRFSPPAWREIVKEMNGYDPEIVPEDKIDEIVDFLVENQKINP
ncbi:MAG: hypothetical protein ACMUIM_07650 [bacterium]